MYLIITEERKVSASDDRNGDVEPGAGKAIELLAHIGGGASSSRRLDEMRFCCSRLQTAAGQTECRSYTVWRTARRVYLLYQTHSTSGPGCRRARNRRGVVMRLVVS